MFLIKSKTTFAQLLKKYFSFRNETLSLQPLAEFLKSLREEDFDVVVSYLKDSKEIAANFGYYIHHIFHNKPFNLSLTEADILSEGAFVPEFRKRILNKILPPVANENTIWFLVDNVTIRPRKDLEFLRNIPEDQMDEFFRILGIDSFITKPGVKKELLFSINILAWRVIGSAMDVEVVNMVPEYRNFDNPFLALQNEIDVLNKDILEKTDFQLSSKDGIYKQIKIYLEQCLDFVDNAFKNSAKYGISSKINLSLLKMRQQLERMQNILWLLVIDEPEDRQIKSKMLVFNILDYKSHKNDVKDLINDSSRLMSHLITNHTAETGSHYITSSFKDYMKMFWRASGGGVIVGALCVLKMLYSYIHGSEFLHAALYAFNYAMGFVMIYLMSFILATKQPAMTAATMAKVLSDGNNTKKNYIDFAHLVSKLFRSQFIAFVGNVLWSFPVALAIIYGLDVLVNANMSADKSDTLLKDLNPFESKAILHAGIAGVFLFISGIIAGNIGNNSVYYKMPERIAKSAMISSLFGKKFAEKLSVYYANNWAGIVSNAWFGVFLGATGPIGKFLGLDLDIRHITFAAGNFALGLYGKGFNVTQNVFWISFITVFLIGFFNFIVSFGLSMMLAFRSRKVSSIDIKNISREIFRYFLRNPLKFFFPIRSYLDGRAKEMMEKTLATKSEDH